MARVTPAADGGPAGSGPVLRPARMPERDSHGRREEVLDTALRIFATHGYRATTIEDIARELDFTPAALYYYFKSKASLLTAIVSRPIDMMMAQAREIEASDAPAIEKLERAIRGHIRLITEHREWFSVMLREQIEMASDELGEVNEKNREYRRFLTRLIDAAVEDGSLTSTNSRVISLILIGAINWTLQWWREGGVLDSDEVANILVRLVLDGLRPRHDGPTRG